MSDSFTLTKDITDGAVNDVKRKFAKIDVLKRQIDKHDVLIDEALSSAKLLNDVGDLPAIPTVEQIGGHFGVLDQNLSNKLNEFDTINDLAGPCLSPATNALKSLIDDSLAFIDDAFDWSGFTFPNPEFPEFDIPFPDFALDLSSLYSKRRFDISFLGIDTLIQSLLSESIPCLDDALLVAESIAEINNLTEQMGLELDGTMTDDSYGSLIKSQMEAKGLPASLEDGTKLMDSKFSSMNETTQSVAKQKALSFVPSSVKSLVPKKFF